MLVIFTFNSCEEAVPEPTGLDFITFEEREKEVAINVGASLTDQIVVYTATKTGSEKNINIIVDESSTIPLSSLTIPSSVVVPSGTNEAIIEYTMNYNDDFSITGGTLVLRIENVKDNLVTSSQVEVLINVVCDSPVTIDFLFDGYADETTWSIEDTNGNTLYTGGGYSEGQETASREVCLADGDYTFTVNDRYGDGLTYPNLGNVSLSFKGATLIDQPGNFGSEFSADFTITN